MALLRTTILIQKAPEGISQECFDSLINFKVDTFFSEVPYQMQFTQKGDSLINYTEYYCTMPAIFKPWAAVGTSWIVPNNAPWSTFSEVEITCDSIVLGNFLGVTDSLKYFSVKIQKHQLQDGILLIWRIMCSVNIMVLFVFCLLLFT